MNKRKKSAIPRNERRCFTVSGAGQSKTADNLDSVGDHPCGDVESEELHLRTHQLALRPLDEEVRLLQRVKNCHEFEEVLGRVVRCCTDQEIIAVAHAVSCCNVFMEDVIRQGLKVARRVGEIKGTCDPLILPTGCHKRSFMLIAILEAQLVEPTLEVEFRKHAGSLCACNEV